LYLRETIDEIQVHRHWTYIAANNGLIKKTIGHISFLPSALLLSNRHLESIDVAIGTSPTFFAAIAAAILARRRNIPFVMEVRDLWPAILMGLGVVKNSTVIRALERIELALYRQAAGVVTVSEAFRRDLLKRGTPAHKVATIPNGADLEYWKPMNSPQDLREKLRLNGRFIVLYIGAHGISHGLEHVLESAGRLRQVEKIHFLFVGSGAQKESLIKRAKEMRLENVTFLDPAGKDEVRRYYALSDVCLVPLRNIPLFEGFVPSKMFEILAMGRPIVGSVRGEAAEILERSGGASVVPPEGSAAMAEAILRIAGSPEQARIMGTKGRSFVERNYSRYSLARRYSEVLQEAIAEHRRGYKGEGRVVKGTEGL
jgi:hypothetical protein